jgi:hypothetical protein
LLLPQGLTDTRPSERGQQYRHGAFDPSRRGSCTRREHAGRGVPAVPAARTPANGAAAGGARAADADAGAARHAGGRLPSAGVHLDHRAVPRRAFSAAHPAVLEAAGILIAVDATAPPDSQLTAGLCSWSHARYRIGALMGHDGHLRAEGMQQNASALFYAGGQRKAPPRPGGKAGVRPPLRWQREATSRPTGVSPLCAVLSCRGSVAM